MTTENPRARAQAIIDRASRANATFDNLEELIRLVEAASSAETTEVADFFSSALGSNVPWNRGTLLGFANLTGLLQWRDCQAAKEPVTVSHAFSAVNMTRMTRRMLSASTGGLLGHSMNASINHSADVVDGAIKGLQKHGPTAYAYSGVVGAALYAYHRSRSGARMPGWMEFWSTGYGRGNRLGDRMGDHMARSLDLHQAETISQAFRGARVALSL